MDVVVFGHTHVPAYNALDNGKYYINEGTWIDHNTDYPEATRTFAVITTGDKTTAGLYMYGEDGSVTDIAASVSGNKSETASETNPLEQVTFDYKTLENYGDDDTQARYIEVSGLADAALQEKLNKELKDFCLQPAYSAGNDTTYNIMPVFEVAAGDLLSLRTYDTAYTTGAAYPVASIRSQLFSLTAGAKDTGSLWDFIKDKDAFKQLALDGKFGFIAAGIEGEIPEELKAAAYNELAGSIDTSEFAAQFYFGDGGSLNVWLNGMNHATGDYWLFDISVTELEELATDRLLPVIEAVKELTSESTAAVKADGDKTI